MMASSNVTSELDHQWLRFQKLMAGDSASVHGSEVGIALFGLGRIGTVHLDNLSKNPRVRLLYCVEEFTDRFDFVKRRWGLSEPETTFIKPADKSRVFQDGRVAAILICTPTYEHEALVLKGLESGKAVFCEKPLSLTEEGTEKCIIAAKKYGKPLMIGYNRRFDPSFRALKKRIESGEIGQVQILKTCSRDCPRSSIEYLKTSGGYFHDSAVHDIDFLCWVVGEYPDSVSAYAHTYLEDIKSIGDYDTVVITMKFPCGTIATIDLSRFSIYGYDQRIEAFGSKGMLTCGDVRPLGLKSHDEKGTTEIPIFYSFASRYEQAYHLEIEHFLDVVQGKEKLEMKPETILAISKIASACQKVVNTGKSAPLSWK